MDFFYIGVMSGSSLDGIDIALLKQDDRSRLLATHYIPMPEDLYAELLGLCSSGVDELARAAIAEQSGAGWSHRACRLC